jgi:hypothetical protein
MVRIRFPPPVSRCEPDFVIAEAEDIFGDGVNGSGAVRVLGRAGWDPRQPGRSGSGARQTGSAQLEGCIPFHGGPAVRFPFAPGGKGQAYFQLCRPDPPRWHAIPPPGATVDLGAKGRPSGRQRPIGEVDRANQNRLAPNRQMRLVYP